MKKIFFHDYFIVFLGKPLLGEKYGEGKRRKRKKEERIMTSLVATTSALARKPCVSTHYVRTNNAKFSGHYVYPRTETVRAHALRSHQYRVRQRGCSLTHSERTPPAVHPWITIWVHEIEIEKRSFFLFLNEIELEKKKKKKFGSGIFCI